MPGTLRALSALGIDLAEEEGYTFQGIRFSNPTDAVAASFPDGTGLGVRRTHLHRRMVERAEDVGARFAWGSHAELKRDSRVEVNGAAVHFRWLIGADGTASRVRTWAGLDATIHLSQRFGFRRHYRIAPWSKYVEIYWGDMGQIYVTPVAQDQVCLIFIAHDPHAGRGDFLQGFPEVIRRLQGAAMVTPPRAAASATRRLKEVANSTVALVGDASGSVDAITGEGLAMSFRQATALAVALERGDLHHYSLAHRAISRLPHRMSTLLLSMDRSQLLQRHALRILAAEPPLFREFLCIHTGAEGLLRFTLRRGPSLAWSLLAGTPYLVSTRQPR